MDTPHNSPVRDRLMHTVEPEEIRFWKDQVAWMGLMMWNLRHRTGLPVVPPPPVPMPPTPEPPPATVAVGSFTDTLPPCPQRTVRYAYPERQYVN